ncbi:MAG TPA: hypothetical protein VFZ53_10280 [Polyangiaceae bacterium]
MTVLEAQRGAAPTTSAAPRAGEDPTTALDELQKRLGHLREQAQDLVDQVTRVVERLPSGVPISPSVPSELQPRLQAFDGATMPVLRAAVASPGGIGRTALGLFNESRAPASIVLRATSLVSDLGDELPGSLVTFAPNPLHLPAAGELPVQANVRVPPGVRPGTYSGLVQAVGLAATRAVLTVIVAPAASE